MMREYIDKETAGFIILQYRPTRRRMLQALEDAKAADVRENVHGSWESDGYGHIYCIACNEANVTLWRSKFCPSCGAIMDKKEV